MLKLGRQSAVFGDGSPIIREDTAELFTDIDHRFNGKEHALFDERACPFPPVVQNVRLIMEDSA
jgi:hypothetical protein